MLKKNQPIKNQVMKKKKKKQIMKKKSDPQENTY